MFKNEKEDVQVQTRRRAPGDHFTPPPPSFSERRYCSLNNVQKQQRGHLQGVGNLEMDDSLKWSRFNKVSGQTTSDAL